MRCPVFRIFSIFLSSEMWRMRQELLEVSDLLAGCPPGAGFNHFCLFCISAIHFKNEIIKVKYNFCQYKQSNISTLGNFNCFQSNLLNCCQHIFHPEGIIGFPLMLTLPSYGEIISFLLAFPWFFLIIFLSRKTCKFFKEFSRGTVLSLHIRFSLVLKHCAGCKTNISEFCILCAHIHTCEQENEKNISLPDRNFSLRFIQLTSLKIFSESVYCVRRKSVRSVSIHFQVVV